MGEAWQLAERGTIPGAKNISRGELDIRADTELPRRDPTLQDRTQKIILTCGGGGKATLCAEILVARLSPASTISKGFGDSLLSSLLTAEGIMAAKEISVKRYVVR